jgi:enamine deaminase RidA (YjgF/YER057c/UK114 family)
MITRHGPTPIMHRVVEHGGVLYVGGIVADDRSVPMKGQTEQILVKIAKILGDYGSGLGKVLTATLYITDMGQKDGMNEAWNAAFAAADLPARATIGVADLGPNILIEIVFTAAR